MVVPSGVEISSLGIFFVVCAVVLFFMGRVRTAGKDLPGKVVFAAGTLVPLVAVVLLLLLDIEPLFETVAAAFSVAVAVFIGLAMINLLTVGELRE